MRTVARKQDVINEDLKVLKQKLACAHKAFDERYAAVAYNYKSQKFDSAFDPALYAAKELLSSCDFYLKRINEHYGDARYTGFTPFSSYDVFGDFLPLMTSLLKSQVMLLTCVLKVREQTGLDVGSSLVLAFSEDLSRFTRELVKANSAIGKGDNSPSGLKIRQFLDVSDKCSAELLKLAKKKGLSLKDIESSAAVRHF